MIKSNLKKGRLSTKAFIAASIVAAAVTGCSKADENNQKAEQPVDDFFVGMCFDDAHPEDTVVNDEMDTTVTNIDIKSLSCTESHDNEAYYIHQLPDEAEAQLESEAFFEDMLDICELQFKDYIGQSYKESFYEMSVLFPTPESWQQGHKEAICYAFHPEAEKLTMSLKGINQ